MYEVGGGTGDKRNQRKNKRLFGQGTRLDRQPKFFTYSNFFIKHYYEQIYFKYKGI